MTQTALQKAMLVGRVMGRRQYFREPEIDRFNRWHEKISSSGCWVWVGSILKGGYGRFGIPGDKRFEMVLAHRWAYEHFVGPIAQGLFIDHRCRNRACVNPAHLEAVTPQENNVRSLPYRDIATASHCKHGHPWTAETRYIGPSGKVDCRICRQISWAKTIAKRRAS